MIYLKGAYFDPARTPQPVAFNLPTREGGTIINEGHAMIMYGLNTCSECRKARKALEDAGKDVSFRDVRDEPLDDDELAVLITEFGDRLVDKTTNDYRGLNDWLKASEAEAQISAKPKVMARPVIRDQDKYYLGWDAAVQTALLG